MYVRTPWRTPGFPIVSVALCLSPSMPERDYVSLCIRCAKPRLTFATSLYTNQPNLFIGDEIIESSNCIASSTDAGDNNIR